MTTQVRRGLTFAATLIVAALIISCGDNHSCTVNESDSSGWWTGYVSTVINSPSQCPVPILNAGTIETFAADMTVDSAVFVDLGADQTEITYIYAGPGVPI